MTLFIVDRVGTGFVVRSGENTLQAAASAVVAAASADAAELSAATAEAAAGPTYASTVAGLAATASGEAFAVDNGDGTVTVYLNSAGSAVAQRTLATTGALAASGGAGMVGVIQSGAGAVASYVESEIRNLGVRPEQFATIEQAITEASTSGRPLILTDGEEYTISSNVSLTTGLVMRGNATIKMGANISGIVIEPARSVSTTVSAIANAVFPAGTGIEQSTALTVASATGFAAGDICHLRSADTYPFDATMRRAELVRINAISGTTIYLSGVILDTYSTSVVLEKLNDAQVSIDGPTFRFDGDPLVPTSKTRFAAVTLIGCVQPYVNATFRDDLADGLRLFTCWQPTGEIRVRNLRNNIANSLFGYGVAAYGANFGGMLKITADNVRHAYTDGTWLSGTPIRDGRAINMTIYDSIATNCSFASWDTHPGAYGTRFVNCGAVFNVTNNDQTSRNNSYGFQDRAINSKFIGCWTRGIRVPFYLGSVLQNHGVTNETEIIGGIFERVGTSITSFCGLPTKTSSDTCKITVRDAVLKGYVPVQSAQTSNILTFVGGEIIGDESYGMDFPNNTGGMEFYGTTFRGIKTFRLGQSNNCKLIDVKRINTASNIEPIIPGVGSTHTIHNLFVDAPSYGFGQIIRAGQGSDAGTVTVNLGTVFASNFTGSSVIGTNGTATLTINNMDVRQKPVKRGATGSRPTLLAADIGFLYLDTTLDADGKPIWWTGTAWVDATGATV